MTFCGHYMKSPQSGRRELIVDPAIMAAVVTAAISAAGTVLAAWVQARAQRRSPRDDGDGREGGEAVEDQAAGQDTHRGGGRPGARPR
jgi:hypothetical protein